MEKTEDRLYQERKLKRIQEAIDYLDNNSELKLGKDYDIRNAIYVAFKVALDKKIKTEVLLSAKNHHLKKFDLGEFMHMSYEICICGKWDGIHGTSCYCGKTEVYWRTDTRATEKDIIELDSIDNFIIHPGN